MKAFEWIVIDDASTDNTEELVQEWINTCDFKITYRKQERGGKHRAINVAVKLAEYDWFFIVDSDDFLTIDAIEKIHRWIETIGDDASFAGVSGLKGYIGIDKIVGGFPKRSNGRYVDATNLQRRKFGLIGDKAEVYKTDLLKKYPFPEFDGERFIAEGVVWNRIAKDGYKIRWFNEVIYKCEYLEDGLTKSVASNYLANFEGYTYQIKLRLECFGVLRSGSNIRSYLRIAKQKGLGFNEARKKLGISWLQAVLAVGASVMVSSMRSVAKFILRRGKK